MTCASNKRSNTHKTSFSLTVNNITLYKWFCNHKTMNILLMQISFFHYVNSANTSISVSISAYAYFTILIINILFFISVAIATFLFFCYIFSI